MGMPFLLGTDYLRKIQSVRPQNLVSLWPQNEPLGHGVSTEIVRGYDGAYTAVTLGGVGVPGSGLTSAGYDGATSFNNIHSAGFANDNGLLNPGFETAGAMPPTWANWAENVGDGAIANEVVIVHEGTDSAKLTSGATSGTFIYGAVVVVPGQRRRFRFWTQGDAVNDGRYTIWDATAGADIQAETPTGITAAAWGMVEAEYTVPAGCVLVQHFLACPDTNGGIAYFDACEDRRMDGFLGDQGTVIVPAQVANVGVWTDGLRRDIFSGLVNGSNYLRIIRDAANNTIKFDYVAGGVALTQSTGGLANIDFAFYGMTWDISAGATGEVMYYIDGIASGATDVGLGTWAGDFLNNRLVIGANSLVPAFVWHGDIGPVAVWSDALAPDEMRYLG